MSAEEVGGYIRLLCHQWTKGGLPNDEERLGRMAGLIGSPCLRYVVAKLTLCEDGMLRHPRIEAIRAENEAFRAQQVQSGAKGAQKRWGEKRKDGNPIGKPIPTPLATPLANGCPKDGSPSPSPSPSPIVHGIDVSTPQAKGGVGGDSIAPQPVAVGAGGFLVPTRQDLDARAAMIGLPPREVDKFEAHYGANGWTVSGTPMSSWVHALVKWKIKWEELNAIGNAGSRGGGQPTAAERRNALIAGADATQRQAELTAERERREQQDPDWIPI